MRTTLIAAALLAGFATGLAAQDTALPPNYAVGPKDPGDGGSDLGDHLPEQTVRRLVASDASFDALCHEYGKVIELLDGYEVQVKRLKERRALLEEELLTRIEGHQPQ